MKFAYSKGDIIGQRYLVNGVLGKGGCGIVYSVYDKKTQGVFALKTFLDQYMEDTSVSARFRKEAQVWIALERHPYIVTAFFVDNFSGRYYVALEYIPQNEYGWNTLDEHLRNSTISFRQTLVWSIQFCHGMEYAYSKGITAHRDIKPANIMIDDNNNVRISDFGLAGIIYPDEVSLSKSGDTIHHTMLGTGMGTATHMPPEQFVNAVGCDERSDVYSFGVVLFQMVNRGRLPFYTDNPSNFWTIMRHLHSEGKIPPSNSPLDSIIIRCLAKSPSSRYQSFSNLRTELESLLANRYGISVSVPEMPSYDIWELNNKSNNLNQLGLYEEAVTCAENAIAISDKNDTSWVYKGNALHNLGNYDEAINCYKRALSINNNSGVWGNLGLSYRAKFDYDNALDCYDNVLSVDPENIYTLNNKGACLAQSGRLEEAIACYDKGLTIDNSISCLWTNKGIALVELGDVNNGILCLDKSLSINPLQIEVLRQKGDYLTKNNKLSDAKKVYGKLSKLSQANANDWFNLGILHYNDNETEEANESFITAENLAPNDHEITYFLMEVYYKKQDASNTLKYCDKLISSNKYFDEAISRKSCVLFYSGGKEKAFNLLKSTLNNDPTLDLLWFILSDLYEQTGIHWVSMNSYARRQLINCAITTSKKELIRTLYTNLEVTGSRN